MDSNRSKEDGIQGRHSSQKMGKDVTKLEKEGLMGMCTASGGKGQR